MKVQITYRHDRGWTVISGRVTKETVDAIYVGQVKIPKANIISYDRLPEEKKISPQAG